jgi:hypothetical protein
LLYGIEMKWASEYGYQRETALYWVGFLQGLGIKIERHCAQSLFVHPLYGIETVNKQDPARMARRITLLNKQIRRQEKATQAETDRVKFAAELAKLGELLGRKTQAERYHKLFCDQEKETGIAVLDTGEPEREKRNLEPQLEEAKAMMNQALGAGDVKKYVAMVSAVANLKGQIMENDDMVTT